MIKEFYKIDDIYTPPDKTGKQNLIKKGFISKILLETNLIIPLEFINERGKIVKNKCTIKYNTDYYILNHPYEKIKNIILKEEVGYPEKITIKGFNYKNKI